MMGVFSDDGGLHWQHSATNLSVPHTAPNPKPACGAADEPMTVELSNGTLWTLIRTNGGGSERMATSTLLNTSKTSASDLKCQRNAQMFHPKFSNPAAHGMTKKRLTRRLTNSLQCSTKTLLVTQKAYPKM